MVLRLACFTAFNPPILRTGDSHAAQYTLPYKPLQQDNQWCTGHSVSLSAHSVFKHTDSCTSCLLSRWELHKPLTPLLLQPLLHQPSHQRCSPHIRLDCLSPPPLFSNDIGTIQWAADPSSWRVSSTWQNIRSSPQNLSEIDTFIREFKTATPLFRVSEHSHGWRVKRSGHLHQPRTCTTFPDWTQTYAAWLVSLLRRGGELPTHFVYTVMGRGISWQSAPPEKSRLTEYMHPHFYITNYMFQ